MLTKYVDGTARTPIKILYTLYPQLYEIWIQNHPVSAAELQTS